MSGTLTKQKRNEVIKILEAELDKVVTEVMAKRCKRPDLTDEEWFNGLPLIELPSLAKKRKVKYIIN